MHTGESRAIGGIHPTDIRNAVRKQRQPELERIPARQLREFVEERLACPHPGRIHDRTPRSVRHRARHAGGVHAQIGNRVRIVERAPRTAVGLERVGSLGRARRAAVEINAVMNVVDGEIRNRRAMRERDQVAARIQATGQPIGAAGLKIAVTHVVLTRPYHLDRSRDRFRDLRRLGEIVRKQAPPESASHERGVNPDLALGKPGDLDRLLHAAVLRLGRRPEFRAVRTHVGGAVHDLDRRVRLERKRVGGLETLRGGRQRGGRVLLVAHLERGVRELALERGFECVRVEIVLSAGDPAQLERGPRAKRGPGAGRHHGDPVLNAGSDRHHRQHARHRERCGAVMALEPGAQHRRALDAREHHSGHAHIEAIAGVPGDDVGPVDAFDRRAEEAELIARLERHVLGRLQFRRGGRQRAEPCVAAARAMDHLPVLGDARRRRHLPFGRGRGDQHGARDGARAAQQRVRAGPAVAAAGVKLDARVLRTGDGLFDAHAAPVRVQLLGHHHRQQRAHALAHLVPDDGDRDPVVGRDAYEDVRREVAASGAVRSLRGGAGLAHQLGQAGGDHESRHRGRGAFEKRAAGECHRPFRSAAAACRMAARIRLYVPHRQTEPDIAASTSASVGDGVSASSAAAVMIMPGWQYPH